ncbi:hypothetical protein M422DRAFT_267277 [Sphaerobolus stellatus SS14]|uniref:Uncharacterized protein n=1 Tax=Sphaerobolus stellatus (strain SS14) TaxID=990650 RepID=A0A0C9TM75_SPHS4|nr:hypothetical protein M422DRAFT_267277 [Sphaerobolus stellatus SS14]
MPSRHSSPTCQAIHMEAQCQKSFLVLLTWRVLQVHRGVDHAARRHATRQVHHALHLVYGLRKPQHNVSWRSIQILCERDLHLTLHHRYATAHTLAQRLSDIHRPRGPVLSFYFITIVLPHSLGIHAMLGSVSSVYQ